MSEVIIITESEGSDLHEESYMSGDSSIMVGGHSYSFIETIYGIEDHRWNSTDLHVFERDDGKLFGMKYDVGLTENQEDGFVYNSPALYEVVRKEKTVTTVYYERVK